MSLLQSGLQYLEVPLEGRVGNAMGLEQVSLFSVLIIFYQHHGVNQRVHSRQLSIYSNHTTMTAHSRLHLNLIYTIQCKSNEVNIIELWGHSY